ncbi:MAG: hypothetical protein JXR07_02520 [Reichenbachiella sp.]
MKILSITTVVLTIIGSSSTIAMAQGGPPATPIDGGLGLLLGAGLLYGIKKFRNLNNK